MKLIKAGVTRWLSHGQAGKRVLDSSLVAGLDQIYVRKHEPAAHGLRDSLAKSKVIAALCFLTDVLLSINKRVYGPRSKFNPFNSRRAK